MPLTLKEQLALQIACRDKQDYHGSESKIKLELNNKILNILNAVDQKELTLGEGELKITVLNAIGYYQSLLKQHLPAIGTFTIAINLNPGDHWRGLFYAQRAYNQGMLKLPDQSIEDYTKALACRSDTLLRATCFIGRGQQRQNVDAISDYITALSIGADNENKVRALQGLCTVLLNGSLLSTPDYKKISPYKEQLLGYILTGIKKQEDKVDVLTKALSRTNPLGQLFWTKRGFFAPKVKSGTLNTICGELAKLTHVSKSEVVQKFSIFKPTPLPEEIGRAGVSVLFQNNDQSRAEGETAFLL